MSFPVKRILKCSSIVIEAAGSRLQHGTDVVAGQQREAGIDVVVAVAGRWREPGDTWHPSSGATWGPDNRIWGSILFFLSSS